MASPENFYLGFFFGRLTEVITKFSSSTAAFIITVGIAQVLCKMQLGYSH